MSTREWVNSAIRLAPREYQSAFSTFALACWAQAVSENPPWIFQRTACRSYDACCHQRLASACRMPAIEEASFLNDHLGKGVPGPAHGGEFFRGIDQEVHPA